MVISHYQQTTLLLKLHILCGCVSAAEHKYTSSNIGQDVLSKGLLQRQFSLESPRFALSQQKKVLDHYNNETCGQAQLNGPVGTRLTKLSIDRMGFCPTVTECTTLCVDRKTIDRNFLGQCTFCKWVDWMRIDQMHLLFIDRKKFPTRFPKVFLNNVTNVIHVSSFN